MMKFTLLFILVCTFVLISSTLLIAQPPVPAAPPQTPVDGGLGLLAAAGGAYAWKKLKGRKKAEN